MSKYAPLSGFLVLEAMIALALFSICVSSTIVLSWSSHRMFDEAYERQALLSSLSSVIADPSRIDPESVRYTYGNDATITTISSSTDQIAVGSTSISFSILEPDTFSAYGKDTCPPTLDFLNQISLPITVPLPISPANLITGLSVKDGFAYISTNSKNATDPDLFIIDVRDLESPKIVSSLDTGPGLNALAVAGPYVFGANESSTDQLQVIDIHDRSHPMLVAQAKVPLDISSSSAPYGSAVFYDKGFIYLGTEKGDSPEFTIWNVADPIHPTLAGRYEIGNKVEKIAVQGTRAYVGGTGSNQLIFFDISNPTNPSLVDIAALPCFQTQSAEALDVFEGDTALGRTQAASTIRLIQSSSSLIRI